MDGFGFQVNTTSTPMGLTLYLQADVPILTQYYSMTGHSSRVQKYFANLIVQKKEKLSLHYNALERWYQNQSSKTKIKKRK